MENKALSREPQGGFVRRSFSVRIATLLLVVSLAMPALAAPRRDDSPIDDFKNFVSRLTDRIIQIFDLADQATIPK